MKLKIKGLGWCEYESPNLEKLKGDLKNPSIPKNTKVDLGFWMGELGDIQSIWSGNEQIQSYANKKPHWVIYSEKQDSIWLKSFTSEEEAKAEFDFSGLSSDWKIIQK